MVRLAYYLLSRRFLKKKYYQCGFTKSYSKQHLFVATFICSNVGEQNGVNDNKKVFAVLLIDLSKTFDCLSHELIIAKLNAYGFSLPALNLFHDYLSHRQQRTKIKHAYKSWKEVVFGVRQVSVFGVVLFNTSCPSALVTCAPVTSPVNEIY